jgi:hypothetical protein
MQDIYDQIVASGIKTIEFVLNDNKMNLKVYQKHVNDEENYDVFEKLKKSKKR